MWVWARAQTLCEWSGSETTCNYGTEMPDGQKKKNQTTNQKKTTITKKSNSALGTQIKAIIVQGTKRGTSRNSKNAFYYPVR